MWSFNKTLPSCCKYSKCALLILRCLCTEVCTHWDVGCRVRLRVNEKTWSKFFYWRADKTYFWDFSNIRWISAQEISKVISWDVIDKREAFIREVLRLLWESFWQVMKSNARERNLCVWGEEMWTFPKMFHIEIFCKLLNMINRSFFTGSKIDRAKSCVQKNTWSVI